MFKRVLHRLLGLLGGPPARDILSQVSKDLCTASTLGSAGFFYTGEAFRAVLLLAVAVVLFIVAIHFRQEP